MMKKEVRYGDLGLGTLNHILYTPENEMEDVPLLVYLHGAGERGNNTDHLKRHAVPKMIEEGYEIPAIVLCPQCPAQYVWNNVVREVKRLIDEVAEEFFVSKNRICLTGSIMGGYGTWEMGLTYRNFFAGIAPVCGGAMPWRAQNLRTTPVATWHGNEDTTVALINSELMVEAVNVSGGNARLYVLEGFGHNDGIEEAYYRTGLISWLLDQRRTDFTEVAEALEEYF